MCIRDRRATVPDAVHLVDDRRRRVAGAEEVGVQRVRRALLDSATGGDERLAGDLAAEDALAPLLGERDAVVAPELLAAEDEQRHAEDAVAVGLLLEHLERRNAVAAEVCE